MMKTNDDAKFISENLSIHIEDVGKYNDACILKLDGYINTAFHAKPLYEAFNSLLKRGYIYYIIDVENFEFLSHTPALLPFIHLIRQMKHKSEGWHTFINYHGKYIEHLPGDYDFFNYNESLEVAVSFIELLQKEKG